MGKQTGGDNSTILNYTGGDNQTPAVIQSLIAGITNLPRMQGTGAEITRETGGKITCDQGSKITQGVGARKQGAQGEMTRETGAEIRCGKITGGTGGRERGLDITRHSKGTR